MCSASGVFSRHKVFSKTNCAALLGMCAWILFDAPDFEEMFGGALRMRWVRCLRSEKSVFQKVSSRTLSAGSTRWCFRAGEVFAVAGSGSRVHSDCRDSDSLEVGAFAVAISTSFARNGSFAESQSTCLLDQGLGAHRPFSQGFGAEPARMGWQTGKASAFRVSPSSQKPMSSAQ